MEQRPNYAALKDAKILCRREECARDMEQSQWSTYAAVRDARIKFEVKECVGGTVQRSNYAAVKDVQI